MNVLDKYIKKHAVLDEQIANTPSNKLGICIVIPSYNEENITPVLKSISECYATNCDVEVILVINGRVNDTAEIRQRNFECEKQFYEFVSNHKNDKISYYLIKVLDIPIKYAGVGYARKVGMDECVRRFIKANNKHGIIATIDVDCEVEKNYLLEIERLFNNKNAKACSIRFEHPIKGNIFSDDVYEAISQYELYLHYHLLSTRYAQHPFAYHTIGSAMAVRADIYAMQGGMNVRKAGEDFYFLQKIIPLGNFYELNSTCVYPSPRISERVPFGTGVTIKKILNSKNQQLLVYNFQAYLDLKLFFQLVFQFYDHRRIDLLWNMLPSAIQKFFTYQEFMQRVNEILKNTASLLSFKKRFFRWFNMFQTIKYMNYAHSNTYNKLPILETTNELLNYIDEGQAFNDVKECLVYIRQKVYGVD